MYVYIYKLNNTQSHKANYYFLLLTLVWSTTCFGALGRYHQAFKYKIVILKYSAIERPDDGDLIAPQHVAYQTNVSNNNNNNN
jgi:hypothetical protein